jgi:acyl-[acyl-carrier-protein] desaturase
VAAATGGGERRVGRAPARWRGQCLFVNVLTEDNLPFYFASIDNLFGRDGAWGYWTRRWTAGGTALDRPAGLPDHERARRPSHPGAGPDGAGYRGCFPRGREHRRCVRLSRPPRARHPIAHHNTGKALRDGEGYAVMKRVAADENLHYLFYRDLVSAALDIDPSGMMEAIERQVLSFEMPGTGIPHFAQHARAIARAGIYDLGVHHEPTTQSHWRPSSEP